MLKEDGGSRVCFNPEGGEHRSGVCSLFDVTVALGAHMKLEAQPLALSQVTQSLSLEGSGLVHSFFSGSCLHWFRRDNGERGGP